MKIKVKSIRPAGKYKIFVSFNDGTEGIYDLSDIAGRGVFKSWDEDENFNKVFINQENGAITWPGEIDIDTMNAYFAIRKISPEEYFHSEKKYA